MLKLLHAGFDTLDVSFQGALPASALKDLAAAKAEAARRKERQLVRVGSTDAHVFDHGAKGGYAFILDTGPLGEMWTFKENTHASEWNIGVSVGAAALATRGYAETKARLYEQLAAMGCSVISESIRRADFAMDFLMPGGFTLDLENVVAPSRSKVSPHWGDTQRLDGKDMQPSAVIRGRRLESVTVGKMPGRQVIIYDKRKAAIDKKAFFWFDVWGIDRATRPNVWRVELRAGKKELKERRQITTFADFECSVGDVYTDIAEAVRYHEDRQTDSNVSRQTQHPLWDAAQATVQDRLFTFRSGLCADQVKEVFRDQQCETYLQQIQGMMAGLSVAVGTPEAELPDFPEKLADILARRITEPGNTFHESRERAERRLHFIA